MPCDAAGIQARIDGLHDERESLDEAADAAAGPVGHDLRHEIDRINAKIRELERALDICVTADEEDPPVERRFEIIHFSLRFRGWEIPVINLYQLSGELGFWFSASRRHVRIHEWPRLGATLVTTPSDVNLSLQASGSMQRQQSGSRNANGHIHLPVRIHIHSSGHPDLASANVTLRTEPPGAFTFCALRAGSVERRLSAAQGSRASANQDGGRRHTGRISDGKSAAGFD